MEYHIKFKTEKNKKLSKTIDILNAPYCPKTYNSGKTYFKIQGLFQETQDRCVP